MEAIFQRRSPSINSVNTVRKTAQWSGRGRSAASLAARPHLVLLAARLLPPLDRGGDSFSAAG
jgi:hypothetical protein